MARPPTLHLVTFCARVRCAELERRSAVMARAQRSKKTRLSSPPTWRRRRPSRP